MPEQRIPESLTFCETDREALSNCWPVKVCQRFRGNFTRAPVVPPSAIFPPASTIHLSSVQPCRGHDKRRAALSRRGKERGRNTVLREKRGDLGEGGLWCESYTLAPGGEEDKWKERNENKREE